MGSLTQTREAALYRWFHGLSSGDPAGPDVGEAFRAGWCARESDPFIQWCVEQSRLGRKVVALISPDAAQDGPRYAGYYCEDAPTL